MNQTMPFLLAAALLCGAPVALAENAPSIEATLSANAGKRVTLRLDDGGELSGTVAALSPVTVKLAELTGKEYYDAVVRIDRISAVVVRAREK